MRSARLRLVATLIGLAAVTMLAAPVQAQQVFRIVGADGKVTFSDKPPVEATAKPPSVVQQGGGTSAVGPVGLPFELRQAASKFPVTLYTGNNCGPCGAGRAYLGSRGIPYAEKTITTAQDAEALQRLTGDNSLPLLTVGGQQIKGYSDSEWGQFLDAAGYPGRSVLPASYRNPPISPLVAIQRPAPVAAAAPAPVPAEAVRSSPVQERADNPAGIKF